MRRLIAFSNATAKLRTSGNRRDGSLSSARRITASSSGEISARAFGWLSYTFSVSRQRRRSGVGYTPGAFDQTHNLNAVVSWKPGGGWELGSRLRVVRRNEPSDTVRLRLEDDQELSLGFRAASKILVRAQTATAPSEEAEVS